MRISFCHCGSQFVYDTLPIKQVQLLSIFTAYLAEAFGVIESD